MKAAVAGSTGFIGQLLLDLLAKDSSFEKVSVLTRKPLQLSKKFEVLEGDIASLILAEIDVAFCALGTTIATAGSKQAFYHVDHDLVLSFAQNAKNAGAHTFVLVSSVGADASSSNFYLKVKGETERDLELLGFKSLIILRPSMLMGERKEFRFGELIGKGIMTFINPLMVGSLVKYKGIKGAVVARAMLRVGKEMMPGTHYLEGSELNSY